MITDFSLNIDNSQDRATASRAREFNASHWLKASEFNNGNTELNLYVASTKRSIKADDIAFKGPSLSAPRVDGFKSEQEFEGLVILVDSKAQIFWARLVDTTDQTAAEEEVEFNFNEVPSDDWPLIMPGALFSWNIGLETRDRQVKRVSDIRFRRYFQFSQDSINNAERRAEKLLGLIEEISHIK